MNKHDVIIDFETLSNDALSCAVIDCAIMPFSWQRFLSDNPYTLDDIHLVKRLKLSILDQVNNYKYEVNNKTIEFWQSQSAEVRSKIKPMQSDLTLNEFGEEFISYLKTINGIDYWWSRSNTFDPIILFRIFNSLDKRNEFENLLKFWKVRDTRTHIDAKTNREIKNDFIPMKNQKIWDEKFKKHDSSWDVLGDVLRLQFIARMENDLEVQ